MAKDQDSVHPDSETPMGVPGERGTSALDEGHPSRLGLDVARANVPVGAENYDPNTVEVHGFAARHSRAFEDESPTQRAILEKSRNL